MTRYWESTRPGGGRRAPRADAPSDARVMSLNGTWRFRLSPTAEGTGDAFLAAGFDDSGWDAMRVPSHWVLEEFTPLAGGPARTMRGTEEGPLYTNTAYPIPLDAPRVPTENPTGDYRLAFDVPEGFGQAVLRFKGVDSCAKVWLNGRELGWSTGSRLPFEFDAPVRVGRNVLAVRVHRWSAGTYLEDQDIGWLPGIFRDVELIARPAGAIDDHFVHADYDAATGLGTLRVDASCPAVVEVPELGIRVPAGEAVTIAVDPWSADTPRLYRGTLTSAGERVALAVGFRRVEIVDGVFRVNGAAVTFHGVNRHEHHPDTGRTLDRETMIRDIVMMKRANIDAVRTSHTYGLGKVAEEAIAAQLAHWGEGTSITALRFTNVVAADEYATFDRATEPDYRRDLLGSCVEARDGAQAVALALAHPAPGFRVYTVAAPTSGSATPSRALAERWFPGVPVPDDLGEFESLLSTRRIRDELGFAAAHDWR